MEKRPVRKGRRQLLYIGTMGNVRMERLEARTKASSEGWRVRSEMNFHAIDGQRCVATRAIEPEQLGRKRKSAAQKR